MNNIISKSALKAWIDAAVRAHNKGGGSDGYLHVSRLMRALDGGELDASPKEQAATRFSKTLRERDLERAIESAVERFEFIADQLEIFESVAHGEGRRWPVADLGDIGKNKAELVVSGSPFAQGGDLKNCKIRASDSLRKTIEQLERYVDRERRFVEVKRRLVSLLDETREIGVEPDDEISDLIGELVAVSDSWESKANEIIQRNPNAGYMRGGTPLIIEDDDL